MPEVQLTINGKDKASGKVKGVTGSIIKAQLAVTAIMGATKKLASITKEIITKFSEQERVEKALAQALGETSQELLNQAAALQKNSKFGDEQIIQGQAFLAQMGATEKEIKKLTPAILDLAEAKGMDLKTAFDLASKSVFSSTNAMSRYGIEIEGTVGTSERLESAIGALNEKFEGQAEVARNTLGGSLESLNNAYGDMQEALGASLAPTIRGATEAMIGFTNSMIELISPQDTAIDGLFEERFELNKLAGQLTSTTISEDDRRKAIAEINKKYPKLLDNIDTENIDTKQLTSNLKLLNQQYVKKVALAEQDKELKAALKSQGKLLNEQYKVEAGLYTLLGIAGDELKISNDLVGKSFEDQITLIGKHADGIKITKDDVKFLGDALKNLNDIQKDYVDGGEEVNKINAVIDDMIVKLGLDTKVAGDGFEDLGDKSKKTGEDTVATAETMREAYESSFKEIHESAVDLFNSIGELGTESLENQLTALDQNHEKKSAKMDASLAKEINNIQKSTMAEDEKEIAIAKAQAKATKAKEKSDKDYAKKKYKIDVELFNAKKAMDIANVWISAGTGVAAAWAGAAGWPGPSVIAGIAMAGVLSGIITATAGVQTGMIASRAAPSASFEDGGIVGGTSYTGDNVPINVNSGELILNRAQQNAVAQDINGGGINLNGVTIVANNPEQFIEQLTELRRYEQAAI